MADWKQITARIRRARTGKDPAGQLSNLYEKTRDAMVAFELAKHFEAAGQNADSAKWYLTAAERFRRADWKVKAQEAAVRLGGEVPAGSLIPATSETSGDDVGNRAAPDSLPESDADSGADEDSNELEANVAFSSQVQAATEVAPETSASEAEKKRRRRGRRGGKNRRKPGAARDTATAPAVRSAASSPPHSAHARPVSEESTEPIAPRTPHARSMPSLPVEPLGEVGGASVKGRFGDPGLSSRMSLLEMQFRRLLTCPPVKLDEADRAPVGPGVFVLTDSDLTSYYYVETCQTLRIAVSNLLRGNASRRGVDSIKPQLAEHLGIPEARVAKYLADHCVVRWLQLDEGASHFAHFVISILRPTLNE